MELVLRKINKGKWLEDPDKDGFPTSIERVRGDVFSKCLVTDEDGLSIWYATNDENRDDCLTAIFAMMDRPNKVDVVFIPQEIVAKLEFKDTLGESKAQSLNALHKDIVNINYSSLSTIASGIVTSLNTDKLYERFKLPNVVAHMIKAVELEKVSLGELDDSWHEAFSKYFKNQIDKKSMYLDGVNEIWKPNLVNYLKTLDAHQLKEWTIDFIS